MKDLFSLEGKVALVTGAAYGIGFAMAEALANAGAEIAFNCRGQEHMDKALAEYEAKGIKAHGYICDVTNEADVQKMVADIRQELGHIDILVNNAGIIKRIPMHEMTREEFQQVIDIDLVGPFIMTKAVIPEMIERREGKIINICSMMSELGRETVSAYAAAKGGLKMLTRNICSEYGEYNIQCNAIGPGYIATPQTAPLRERQPDGSRHPFDSFICAKTPARTRWSRCVPGFSCLRRSEWSYTLCRWRYPGLHRQTAQIIRGQTKKGVPIGTPKFLFTISGLESISELSASLELSNLLSSNLNLLLCSGIDTLTSGALVYAECTETDERHLVTLYESVLNSCNCCVKSLFGICL